MNLHDCNIENWIPFRVFRKYWPRYIIQCTAGSWWIRQIAQQMVIFIDSLLLLKTLLFFFSYSIQALLDYCMAWRISSIDSLLAKKGQGHVFFFKFHFFPHNTRNVHCKAKKDVVKCLRCYILECVLPRQFFQD